MTKPVLLVDCYVDDPGAASTYAAFIDPQQTKVTRASRGAFREQAANYSAVIISGSAAMIVDPPPWEAAIETLVRGALQHDVPLLGVCFGHQVIARTLYGPQTVRTSPQSELGWIDIDRAGEDPLLDGVTPRFRVFCSHVEEVAHLPETATVLAGSSDCAVHAFRVAGARMWGVQFHAEMSLAEAKQLVRHKAARYPERGIDVDASLASAVDTGQLAKTLFDDFLAQ